MDRYRRLCTFSSGCAYSPEGEPTTCSHVHGAVAREVIPGFIPPGRASPRPYHPPDQLHVYPAGSGISHAR